MGVFRTRLAFRGGWLMGGLATSAAGGGLLLVAQLACDPGGSTALLGGTEPFLFRSGDVELAGDLSLPASPSGPVPAVVLVHGSGPVTRAGNAPLVRPFLERGIAVVAYDKRGVGGSGGQYRGVGPLNSDSMIALLASDAVAALAVLAKDRRIDATRLGLAGGSQAGWIIPAAAARVPVRFSVILSGPLVSVGEENHYSDAFERSNLPLAATDSVLAAFSGVRGFDPIPQLRRAQGAIYWALGGADRSIPPIRSAALARELIAELGRSAWRVRLYPNGDHGLRDAQTGQGIDFFPEVMTWLDGVLR